MESAIYTSDDSYVRGFRDRAGQLRQFAESLSHEGALRDLLDVARQWDRIADRLEFQARKLV